LAVVPFSGVPETKQYVPVDRKQLAIYEITPVAISANRLFDGVNDSRNDRCHNGVLIGGLIPA
jgi:hypothetical protein